ncbi:hypothetical protein ACIHJG_25315 [Streptomyces sp. NPDC052415]|uniref:hypothetical protein n=1 Tax=Streptomyces sp. NPDC052415 TaxID=3365690 RepID=UPI0037D7B7E3
MGGNDRRLRRRWRGALVTSVFGLFMAAPPRLLDTGLDWDVAQPARSVQSQEG